MSELLKKMLTAGFQTQPIFQKISQDAASVLNCQNTVPKTCKPGHGFTTTVTATKIEKSHNVKLL